MIMNETYKVVAKFELSGRGAVVVIDEITDHVPGRPYNIQVTGVNGKLLFAEAFKEWVLYRQPNPIEKESYTLNGLHKEDISDDANLSFV